MDTADTNEKIKRLRETKALKQKFAKALFGGYRKREVEEYISDLKMNADKAQEVFDEKVEELTAESISLTHERDAMQKRQAELEAEIAALKAGIEESKRRAELAEQENQALRETVFRLKREKEDVQTNVLPQINELKQKCEATSEENSLLLLEREALCKTIEEINAAVMEARAESTQKDEIIQSLTLAQYSPKVDMSSSFYQFKQNLEANLRNATENIENILLAMDSIKSESNAYYERLNAPS